MPTPKSSTKVITLKGQRHEGLPECPKGSEQKSLSGIRSFDEAQHWGERNGYSTVYYMLTRGRVYAFKEKCGKVPQAENKAEL